MEDLSTNDEVLPNPLESSACKQKHPNVFSLPIRESGLNILKPESRLEEYNRSVQLSTPLSLSVLEAELKQLKTYRKKREKD